MSRILTVDIGNSNIVVGSFDGEQLEFTGRIVTKRDYTTEKIVSEIETLLRGWQSAEKKDTGAVEHSGSVQESDEFSDSMKVHAFAKLPNPRNEQASVELTDSRYVHASAKPESNKNTVCRDSYDGAILASVVPEITDKTLDALEKIIGKRPLLVGPFLRTGVDISRYKEGAIGMDRIVDVAAAVSLYGAPVMVCDLGTCTTITVADSCSEDACQEDAGAYDRKEKPKAVACSDVEAGQDMELENPMDEERRAERDLFSSVEKEEKYSGRIIGGMICPGVQLSLDAEATRTSQLPQLSACEVDSLLGLDTASNMMSGVVAGTGMMIAELARRLVHGASSNATSGKISSKTSSKISCKNESIAGTALGRFLENPQSNDLGNTMGNTPENVQGEIIGITPADDMESRLAMKVVVTGGLGKLVAPWICSDGVPALECASDVKNDFEVRYEPDLLLHGLRYIYCLNCGK